ncbi:MAG TPA: hypothetical protein V6C65_30995, partial [Allocoleopsis sp.]
PNGKRHDVVSVEIYLLRCSTTRLSPIATAKPMPIPKTRFSMINPMATPMDKPTAILAPVRRCEFLTPDPSTFETVN